MKAIRIALLIVVAIPLALAHAQDASSDIVISRDRGPNPAAIELTPVAAGFTRPLFVTHAADGAGRLFLVEQVGLIWILKDGARTASPFLDISSVISPRALTDSYSELGLLGLAFHPDFRSNGAFFVNYTDRQGSTVVARYQADAENPDRADASSGEILFQLAQPYANHNGGHIEFGHDGYLYIALGDGGAANDPLGAGQNLQLMLGSILRIDVDSASPYAIPPDNPFVGEAGARAEIWAYGLRNVWRFAFDRATGDMYMADVGQNQWEEINFQPADSAGGENYGWNVWEGSHIFAGGNAPNHVPPIYEYSHSFGCSVTGGNVYRGEAIAEMEAVYLFGDWCSGRIWGAWRDHDLNWHADELMNTGLPISSFGEDEAGEVYVIDYGGTLYRVEPTT
ncbi:MAG: PQQ-dependent sugar dehydrogenase [Chloroflexota bacterium]|nr:PQQ-dependent sugar dehydrogenase [Chloroflexota bacterium]